MGLIFQEKIKKLRRIEGLTQTELAERIEVSKTAIYQWERGASVPNGYNLRKLAEALGTTISYLHGETDVCAYNEKIPAQQIMQRACESTRDGTVKRYYDPVYGIYEIIGDIAEMQEKIRYNYKNFHERELIVLHSQINAYIDLIDKIRALESWKNSEDREKS